MCDVHQRQRYDDHQKFDLPEHEKAKKDKRTACFEEWKDERRMTTSVFKSNLNGRPRNGWCQNCAERSG